MKRFGNLWAAILVAVLSACGGGGGGSDSTVITPPGPVNPPPVSVSCPDGTSAATAAQCAPVTATASVAAGAVVDPATVNQGLTIQFSGAVKPETAIFAFLQAGVSMPGALTANSAKTALTFMSNVRVGYDQADEYQLDINDALGRPVHVNVKFTTSAMSCSSNAKWSNPANFSSTFQNCAAPIGVQVLYDPVLNTRQPNDGCTFTPGTAMSAECMRISANGTLVLNDTTIIVQNDPVEWVGYNSGSAGSLTGTIVLADKTTMKVVGVKQLPGQLLWTIGNPSGEEASITTLLPGATRPSTLLVRFNGDAIVTSCVVNCQ